MRKKTLALGIAVYIGTIAQAQANNSDFVNFEYFPQKTLKQRVLDAGNSWVRRQGEKEKNASYVLSVGGAPTLSALRSITSQWELDYCTTAIDTNNSGVWVNQAISETRTRDPSSFFEHSSFTVVAGVPYEIESKNYKRAGLKRFADYFHSFRIDYEDYSPYLFNDDSRVIDNMTNHDYDTIVSFPEGRNSVHSTTFNDFGFMISVGGSFNDLNSGGAWLNWKNYTIGGKWGGDMWLGDCGYAEVIAIDNTRPTIHGVSVSQVTPRAGQSGAYIKALYPSVSDETSSDNLTYKWVIEGVTSSTRRAYYYNSNTARGASRTVPYTLTVSDGHLSAVYNSTFVYVGGSYRGSAGR